MQIETMTLRAPVELKNKLRSLAKERGLTVNALVMQIFWQYFNK